jgi:hypothetical protein
MAVDYPALVAHENNPLTHSQMVTKMFFPFFFTQSVIAFVFIMAMFPTKSY